MIVQSSNLNPWNSQYWASVKTLENCSRQIKNMLSLHVLLFLVPAITAALTVHLVPHTHDDVGWLKTVDEYFSGSNNTIQHAAVRNILNAVVLSLEENPDRRFTYVEQAFFQRWWRELTPAKKKSTQALVKSGQLNFVNGVSLKNGHTTTVNVPHI